MKLINTDGMAFIGPGSEWFWAAAQFVVVVVSLYGIYHQLRSQGAANAVQRIATLEGEWKSPRMIYARLVLALHLKYEPPNLDGLFKAGPLLNFFVNLANLNEAGYLSVEEIEANWGMQIQDPVGQPRGRPPGAGSGRAGGVLLPDRSRCAHSAVARGHPRLLRGHCLQRGGHQAGAHPLRSAAGLRRGALAGPVRRHRLRGDLVHIGLGVLHPHPLACRA